jgi:DNA primase
MAKTYLSSIKYEIHATYDVAGVVEKPDIVGAIFGQSEGLLGEDMDLKELQQNGKIGRIEITVNKGKGQTTGNIVLPSSLDRVKTSILAAAMETVEKVGPCEAHVNVNKIIDTRKEKREVITTRAQQLLKQMMKFEGAESSELAETIKTSIRTGKILEYNGLAAGPEVETSPTIIVVEGRADVLKLLSYGINSVVAMDGSNISPQLIKLCKEKEVTMLVDGDRGGQLNSEKLSQLTKVDYIAVAPDGKEVEELTQKEILQALKRRREANGEKQSLGRMNNSLPERRRFDDRQNNRGYTDRNSRYSNGFNRNNQNRGFENNRYVQDNRGHTNNNRDYNNRPRYSDRRFNRNENQEYREYGHRPNYPNRSFNRNPTNERFGNNKFINHQTNDFSNIPNATNIQEKTKVPEDILALGKDMNKLKGSLKARLYDDKKKKIKDVAVKDLLDTITKTRKKIDTIAFDGIVTKRLIETAETKGVKNIIGVRKSKVSSEKLGVYTL